MKKIILENFRCYSYKEIEFKRHINLLIGDNATGKTSILKACKYVMSTFFSGFNDENTIWNSPGVDDFKLFEKGEMVLPDRPINIRFNFYKEFYELPLSPNKLIWDDLLLLSKSSKKNSRPKVSGLIPLRDYAKLIHKNYITSDYIQEEPLPLFVGFSTDDIHTSRRISPSLFKKYNKKASFGYYNCLNSGGLLKYWIQRLLILQEGKETSIEIDVVKKAISIALGSDGCNIINTIDIRPNQKEVYFIHTDGREVATDYLSDGYKRLVNIVIDIAIRCALLNKGIYKEDSCLLTKGIVFIDEIDIHLHPTLQTLIVKSLKKAFPQVQFIITTHAPMVMTGVNSDEDNIVYQLSYEKETNTYDISEIQTYGLDASTITDLILNQPPRDIVVHKSLKELFKLIDDDNIVEAKKQLEILKEKFSNNSLPELIEAETMINFTDWDDKNK